MNLTIHDLDTAPEGSRAQLEGIRSDLGVVPNLAAVAAESPTLLAAFDGLRRAVASDDFDPVRREVTGVAVGVAVDNHYGVAFHSMVLRGLGVDDAEIDAMRSGSTPKDEGLAVVYDLAQAIVLTRGQVPDDVIERATAAGLSTAQILELVAECTFAGLVGTIDNLAGHVALDGFLEAERWQ
jgi:alkylhydroperoxidase family enzyme